MKVYFGVDKFVPPSFPVVTTGTFDGVHSGHLVILNRIKELAHQNNGETVVVSFDPHPRTVIHPDMEIQLLQTIDEKIVRLEKAEIDHFVIIPFTKDFSRTSSLSFVRDILIEKLHTKLLVIGYDHQFGRNREGSIVDLEEFADAYDFQIEQIEAQTFEDINISSTKIRKALSTGDFNTANQFLGYPFTLAGTVIHGLKRGKEIGFPTANIEVNNPHKLIPAQGVYAVEVLLNDKKYNGMLNIGYNPTVRTDKKQSVEVHLFDFDADVYGEQMIIHFIKRIRSEQKFDSLEALTAQLSKDKRTSQQILSV